MPQRHGCIASKLVLFMLVLVSTRAFAYDDVLTFRRSASGSIEAVVSGKDDECHIPFAPASSVQVSGAAVTITSPYVYRNCFMPRTPVPYQVTADLGVLGGGASYQVTWTQGPRQLTGVLNPGGGIAPAVAAPTLSSAATATMILVLAAAAWATRRRRHG